MPRASAAVDQDSPLVPTADSAWPADQEFIPPRTYRYSSQSRLDFPNEVVAGWYPSKRAKRRDFAVQCKCERDGVRGVDVYSGTICDSRRGHTRLRCSELLSAVQGLWRIGWLREVKTGILVLRVQTTPPHACTSPSDVMIRPPANKRAAASLQPLEGGPNKRSHPLPASVSGGKWGDAGPSTSNLPGRSGESPNSAAGASTSGGSSGTAAGGMCAASGKAVVPLEFPLSTPLLYKSASRLYFSKGEVLQWFLGGRPRHHGVELHARCRQDGILLEKQYSGALFVDHNHPLSMRLQCSELLRFVQGKWRQGWQRQEDGTVVLCVQTASPSVLTDRGPPAPYVKPQLRNAPSAAVSSHGHCMASPVNSSSAFASSTTTCAPGFCDELPDSRHWGYRKRICKAHRPTEEVCQFRFGPASRLHLSQELLPLWFPGGRERHHQEAVPLLWELNGHVQGEPQDGTVYWAPGGAVRIECCEVLQRVRGLWRRGWSRRDDGVLVLRTSSTKIPVPEETPDATAGVQRAVQGMAAPPPMQYSPSSQLSISRQEALEWFGGGADLPTPVQLLYEVDGVLQGCVFFGRLAPATDVPPVEHFESSREAVAVTAAGAGDLTGAVAAAAVPPTPEVGTAACAAVPPPSAAAAPMAAAAAAARVVECRQLVQLVQGKWHQGWRQDEEGVLLLSVASSMDCTDAAVHVTV